MSIGRSVAFVEPHKSLRRGVDTFLNDLVRTVRVADIVDMLLVAAFLYLIISWLRQGRSPTTARRVVVVGLLFLGVYFLASTFRLFLVESLLQVLLIVLLVAVVVVFQGDIRRMLDRIGRWGISHSPVSTVASRTADILVEAAEEMAENRTGALIAIRGAEPLEPHVQGGVSLNGELSGPLLYSIFAPDTPGHDGAVLIEGNRVTRFGAHLPLSRLLPEVSRSGGTRHTAALGLAEECDALVIVVSEERGAISVAENGELIPLVSASELARRLDEFWQRHDGGTSGAKPRWWSGANLENAVLSLSLAMGAWFLFAYSTETVQRTFQVPIAFRNVPADWILEHDTLAEARVVVSGPEQAVRRLDPDNLVISLDLSDPKAGVNERLIDEDDLGLPPELRLSDVEPREVRVVARRQVSLELPVQIRTISTLADSFVLMPNPSTVTVLVPRESGDYPDRIFTEPVDPRQVQRAGRIQAQLALPARMRLRPGEKAEVEVTLQRLPTSPKR
jgi:uncharacterized protein (TIGR00159 family)